ncbi:hypothetical protein E4T44_05544 [Aureobasidium sp. EXF-8845]|nr:hypothetical protein E4T44_05544 [Aureobasidium sp. EXF-8845]KAI4852680.1 hypothetical protein E4T45_04615 [Aureobasidium sp. EXF-8846]
MALWGGRRETEQVVIVLVFLILAFIILSLRLYTRLIVTRNHGPEDLVITAAFCFSVALVAIVFVGMHIPILKNKLILTIFRGPAWSRSTSRYHFSG